MNWIVTKEGDLMNLDACAAVYVRAFPGRFELVVGNGSATSVLRTSKSRSVVEKLRAKITKKLGAVELGQWLNTTDSEPVSHEGENDEPASR